jgi:hypothetical protein
MAGTLMGGPADPLEFGRNLDTKLSYFGEHSNHFSNRKVQGQQVLCFDGHVGWRTWGTSKNCGTIKVSAGPYMWVQNPQ